jgi:curved DNA-binding protein CbpA
MADLRPVIPDLINRMMELHQKRGSAVLRVERAKEKKQFVVRSGSLSFAESNVPDDHLARVLVHMNLLQRNILPKVTALMKAGKPSDLAILDASDLRAQDLERGARTQAVRILASTFAWDRAGIRSFDASSAPARLTNLCLPLPELVLLAARHAAAARLVPSAMKVLSGVVEPAPALQPWIREVPLDHTEALALSLAQNPASVQDLAPLFPDAAKAPELIQRLLLIGILRLRDRAGASAPAQDTPANLQEMEELLGKLEVANFYEILSISPDATEAVVKSAYHDLARRYHPDRFQSAQHNAAHRRVAEQLFTYITRAYATLGTPSARAVYDSERLIKDSQVEAALQARAAADLEREKMADAIFHAGRVALARGDFENAAKHFSECAWLFPGVARYHYFLGVAQTELHGMQKDAELHLLRSVEIDETQVEPYIALGKLYIKVKLMRRAEAQFYEALKWDPSNREAQRMLSMIGRSSDLDRKS